MDEIETSLGPLPRNVLEVRTQNTDDARECTVRTEYWFMGQCVKSDVHIHLKQGIGVDAAPGAF